jgi:hypothetical protein
MADQTLQRVFTRAFTYLAESGVEMTRAHCRTLLQLIDDALVDDAQADQNGAMDESHLLVRTMDLLPAYFPLAEEALPSPKPPMCRSSIGYSNYG